MYTVLAAILYARRFPLGSRKTRARQQIKPICIYKGSSPSRKYYYFSVSARQKPRRIFPSRRWRESFYRKYDVRTYICIKYYSTTTDQLFPTLTIVPSSPTSKSPTSSETERQPCDDRIIQGRGGLGMHFPWSSIIL